MKPLRELTLQELHHHFLDVRDPLTTTELEVELGRRLFANMNVADAKPAEAAVSMEALTDRVAELTMERVGLKNDLAVAKSDLATANKTLAGIRHLVNTPQ